MIRRCRGASTRSAVQQHAADLAEKPRVAGEEADGVVARRHRRHALNVDAAMGGAQPIQAAKGGGHADRAASVAAKGEIAHGSGDRRRRAAGRAASHVTERFRVHRRAVMSIGAEHTVEELIANGDAGQRGAGVEQAQKSRRRLLRRTCRFVPIGVADRDLVAGDGEKVFDHEAAAGERPSAASGQRLRQSMRNEGVDRVLEGKLHHHRLTQMLKVPCIRLEIHALPS